MQRSLNMLFALVAYAIFFATFLYLVAFVGNLPLAPITVDRGPAAPTGIALVLNIGLIALFGLQHSVMARQGFKKWWTRVVPWSAERSVYVLMASAMLIILMSLWRPIDGTMWSVANEGARTFLWALFALGWLVVLLSTFLINHFELFGLQQAWLHMRGRDKAPPEFRQPLLYKWVRHPLYLGFFLAFWATPDMSYGHLLLAIGMSIYMLIAIRYEERDLIALFGERYVQYRGEVGMLLPRFGGRGPVPPAE
jgi:protein-S-isoprenylcysteine O-methyltransferase Ste14